jgi:hypothetical protein
MAIMMMTSRKIAVTDLAYIHAEGCNTVPMD